MSYRIAEVAERTGVPATAIRYYEDEGLIAPPRRAHNGYRSYDERDVSRLRFVARARHLELPVDELRELVALWEDDDCASVATRMRSTVTERLQDTQRRIAELMALAGELQDVQARLQQTPHDGPCVDDQCVCLDRGAVGAGLPMVSPTTTPTGGADPVACTLEPSAMPQRISDWQGLLARATERTPIPGGTSVAFPVDATLIGELVEVAAAEQACCSFFTFTLQITSDAVRLEVTAPPEAAPVVAAVFGPPGVVS